MYNTILLLILATAIWVGFDAHSIGVKRGQVKGLANMGPWGWFFATLFIWIMGFPLYLANRNKFKIINEKIKERKS